MSFKRVILTDEDGIDVLHPQTETDVVILSDFTAYNDLLRVSSNGTIEDSGISSNNIVQKSQTAGLLKNDGSVDTNTYLTQHQDISGKADKVSHARNGDLAALNDNGNLLDSSIRAVDVVVKSETSGLLKNDGTIDTTTYYSKPLNGIPASDLASGVIPTVPTISTSITDDASSDTMTASPKAVKTYVDSICGNILTILQSI